MYPTEKLAFGSLLCVQNDLSFRVLSRPPMKIRLSIWSRNLRLADDFLIGWFPSPSISAHFPVIVGKIFAMDDIHQESNQCWNHLLTTLTDAQRISKFSTNLSAHVPSQLCNKLRKISEHLWTPHRLDEYSWPKNARPLAPAIRMLRETAKETWRRGFALIVTVKRCSRFIITGKIGFIL